MFFCGVATTWSAAQNAASQVPGPVRAVVVLDPAHGGPETGAKLNDQTLEKDVTLAVAAKLRQALGAAGFTVVATRDSDPGAAIPADQRAEIANRQHALACLLVHATGAGSGVHIYASPLQPPVAAAYDMDARPAFQPVPWDEAQADWVRQSLRLQDYLSNAVSGANLPVVRGRASIPPLDNLTCPALAIELAPMGSGGGARTGVSDAGYQQKMIDAVVVALKRWRDDPASHPPALVSSPKSGAGTGVNQ